MPVTDSQKISEICHMIMAEDWSMDMQQLSNLLYLTNRESLLQSSYPVFNASAYKTEHGVEYRGEAGEIIEWWSGLHDFMGYWFWWLAYLKGYMEYFEEGAHGRTRQND